MILAHCLVCNVFGFLLTGTNSIFLVEIGCSELPFCLVSGLVVKKLSLNVIFLFSLNVVGFLWHSR